VKFISIDNTSTSTTPATTKNRSFVFRACFLDDFQREAIAKFAMKQFGAKKAAVLFDQDNAYPKGLAKFLKKSFEEDHGEGSPQPLLHLATMQPTSLSQQSLNWTHWTGLFLNSAPK